MHSEITCQLFCGNGGEACRGTVVGQVWDVDWLSSVFLRNRGRGNRGEGLFQQSQTPSE